MLLIAIQLFVLVSGSNSGAPVPLVLVGAGDSPGSFDSDKLVFALQTYLPQLGDRGQLVASLLPRDATPVEACAEARDQTKAVGGSTAIWYRWVREADRAFLSFSALPLSDPCSDAVSFAVELSEEQGAVFYRVVALKLSSALRELDLRTSARPRMTLVDTPPPQAPGATGSGAVVLARQRRGPVLGAQIGAGPAWSWGQARPLAILSVTPFVESGGWQFGLRFFASPPEQRTVATGSGGIVIAGMAALVSTPVLAGLLGSTPWNVSPEAGPGVRGLFGSGQHIGDPQRLHQQAYLPFLAAGVAARVALGEHVRLVFAPAIELSPREILVTVGGASLYRAAFVQFHFELRLEVPVG